MSEGRWRLIQTRTATIFPLRVKFRSLPISREVSYCTKVILHTQLKITNVLQALVVASSNPIWRGRSKIHKRAAGGRGATITDRRGETVCLMPMLLSRFNPLFRRAAYNHRPFQRNPVASHSHNRDGTQHRLKVKTSGSGEARARWQAYTPSLPSTLPSSPSGCFSRLKIIINLGVRRKRTDERITHHHSRKS